MPEEDKEQSILAHLEELRKTILDSLIALAIGTVVAIPIAPYALKGLIKLIRPDDVASILQLNYFSPMEVFFIQIKLTLIIGVVICFPFVAKKVWDYIVPALYENERKVIKESVFWSTGLFIVGVLFCLIVILPFIVKFGLSFQQEGSIRAVFGISNIIDLALSLSVVFGFMFQIPLVIMKLLEWDIVSYETLADKRPYVVVAILVVSAFLTPPDVVSQIMLAAPTYLLFELGLYFGKRKTTS